MNDYALLRHLVCSEPERVRRWAVEVLAAVAGGRSRITAVAHPLGFSCLPTWRDGKRGVCIHIWHHGARITPTTSEMHSHSWDLVSVVLYGTVGNHILDTVPCADAPTHRVFEIETGRDADRIRATSRLVTVRVRSRQSFGAGAVYRLPHGVFHVSKVHGAAATVALGEQRDDGPDLSLGACAVHDHVVHRTTRTAAETRQTARTALNHLRDNLLYDPREDRCEPAIWR